MMTLHPDVFARRRTLLFVFLLAVISTHQAHAAPLALINGNVIDVEHRTIHAQSTVLIEGDTVLSVGRADAVKLPADARIIDCSGKWIMPGLVDAHIHLFQSGGLYTRPDSIDLRKHRPYDEERAWVRENAGDLLARYLAAGVTTVIDVGGPMANYEIRERFNREAKSPTIFLTGPLVSTYQPPAFQIEDAPILKAGDPAQARELVRKQLPHKPDFIKIWYIVRPDQSAHSTLPVIQAAIDESHQHGLKVAVHATQLGTAKLALQAGADILVHSVGDEPVDDEFIALLKRRQVPYIPTLIVSRRYSETYAQQLVSSTHDIALANPFALGTLTDLKSLPEKELIENRKHSAREALRQQIPAADALRRQNLKTLIKAGAIVATGTDAGNIGTPHASSYIDELLEMQKASLGNWEILQASTLNGAKVVGREKEFGSIAAGKKANLVILDRNPVQDIRHVQAVHRVVNRGVALDHAVLIDASPVALVQRQVVAYNHRNIDAFLAPYSDDVEIYRFPDQLQYSGKEKMRARYAEMFAKTPDLHCEIVNRTVLGGTVIDHERISGKTPGQKTEAIAIYTTAGGKISKVYFVPRVSAVP